MFPLDATLHIDILFIHLTIRQKYLLNHTV